MANKKRKRKFYRTVIEVEILSEEPYNLEDKNLNDINYDISEGHCSGVYNSKILNQEKTGKQIVKLLNAQKSDAEFFCLNPDGSDYHPEAEEE
ncbi:MAG TPA: hypothetical protein VJY62_15105 [Bacteroidia bacterium]|nr:hypothetical protein [Bacteroidia bacterium]